MSKKVDYSYKSYVLNEHKDLLEQVKRCQLYEYAYYEYMVNGRVLKCLNDNNYYLLRDLEDKCIENNTLREFYECKRISQATRVRSSRLRGRVYDMLLSGSCLFLTLTFNDDTLENTTEKQRRVAVVRYLKSCNARYVANIDFGKENHREHYHALINTDNIKFDSWYKYGAIKCERVRNRNIEKDCTKLSKYVAKLSNHAIKETTRRSALIYSR